MFNKRKLWHRICQHKRNLDTNHNLENGFKEASLDLEVTVEEP